jgi:subtilisin family serine protease/subtilisin-like proprotein convertase family protein
MFSCLFADSNSTAILRGLLAIVRPSLSGVSSNVWTRRAVPGVLIVGLLVTPARGLELSVAARTEAPFDRSRSATEGESVRQWVMVVEPGADATAAAAALGAKVTEALNADKSVVVIEFEEAPRYDRLGSIAQQRAEIVSLEPQVPIWSYPRAAPTDPLIAQQWHLKNIAFPGIDINLSPVWNMTVGSPAVPIDGRGVTVGVVDGGFDYNHPDLRSRYAAPLSYDAFGNPLEAPSTAPNAGVDAKFAHSTMIAGIVAESRNNLGGTGIASASGLADLRLLYRPKTDVQESATESYQSGAIAIKNNSWGPCDYLGHYVPDATGQTVFDLAHFRCTPPRIVRSLPVRPGSALATTLFNITNSSVGRGGRGTILTWAVGNGGAAADRAHERASANDPLYQYLGSWAGYDGWSCNRFVIAVGSIVKTGFLAPYTTPGPCTFVVAPGGASGSGIVSTDLRGLGNGYNTASNGDFTSASASAAGTSFASPMVAGVAALMLQVKPALTYRDIMHILARSAKKIDAADRSWYQNGSGRWVSYFYGFGLLDAASAVTRAKTWTNVKPIASYSPAQKCLDVEMSHSLTGTTYGFTVENRIKVEHVEVLVGVTHPSPGHLQVKVKSPTGARAVVVGVPQQNRQESDLFYKFTTTHFWDELSPGRWAVTVTDPVVGPRGVFNCAKVAIYGTSY